MVVNFISFLSSSSKLVPRGVVPATTSVVMYELDPKGVVHATTSVVT